MIGSDPIWNVVDVDARGLFPNSWNPNVVFNAELALLEESIMQDGWIYPVLANPNGRIIDGYHRWWISTNSQRVIDRYGFMLPCCMLDVSDRDAIFRTIRMNRAKGVHTALRMRDIVRDLIDNHGASVDDLKVNMGMTDGEIDLLYDGRLLKERRLQTHKYSRAWVPVETRLLTDEQLAEVEASRFERQEDDADG